MEHKAYEAVKAQHERIIAINGDGAMPRDYGQNFNAIAQLLADYEALRAERDGYQEALDYVLTVVTNAPNFKDMAEHLRTFVAAALNTQHAPAPQAEWTPEIGQRVIVMREKDEIGHVVGKGENEFEEGYWFIEFREPNVGFGLYELHEFKPAD